MTEFSSLRQKEVIDAESGNRLGFISDLMLEEASGRICAFLLPPKGRLAGLFNKEPPVSISWKHILRIGDDVILVCLPHGEDAP